jgi:hypothetical protein
MPSAFGIFPSSEARTLLCPSCGEICAEAPRCTTCGAILDPVVASRAADDRDRFLEAFRHANSIRFAAYSVPAAIGGGFVPFARLLSVVAVPAFLVWAPYSIFRWNRRYRDFQYSDPELEKAREWVREALRIWWLALLVAPVWFVLLYKLYFHPEGSRF